MKTCFSYIRFSTRKQARGSSEFRQLEIAPRVAQEKGWKLAEELNASDLGLSAFAGHNKKTLEAIVQARINNKIPNGSVLIIEALDRLTRLTLDDAQQLVRSILLSGLEIYIDNSKRHLTKASLNDPYAVILSAVELNAAGEYSSKLSDRVGKAWKKKREDLKSGKRLTKKVPGWIDKDTWKPIKERVEIIKRIFEMFHKDIGISTITKIFNKDNIPTWGNGNWNSSYISQILHDRKVIGEYQVYKCERVPNKRYYRRIPVDDPIKNYFPSIIEPALFFGVQEKLGLMKPHKRTESVKNMFSGIARCGCGARMFLVRSKDRQYYTCWNKIKGLGCNRPTISYDLVESSFAEIIHQSSELFTLKEYKPNVGQLSESLKDIQKKIDNITKAVIGGLATKALIKEQASLEAQASDIEKQIEIEKAKATSQDDPADIVNRLGFLKSDIDLRRRVNSFCLTHIESMTFHKDYYILKVKNGNTLKVELGKGVYTINGKPYWV